MSRQHAGLQARVGLVGDAVAGVQGDEVPNVGGDQCPSLGCRLCEDLLVREPYQGWIGNNRDDVEALGAELLGRLAGSIQLSRDAHG